MVPATLVGEEEGAAGPAMSPVRRASMVSSISGMGGEGGAVASAGGSSTGGSSSALGPNGSTEFTNLEPPKSIPDTDARRSKARIHSKVRAAGNSGPSIGGGSSGREESGGPLPHQVTEQLGSPAGRGKGQEREEKQEKEEEEEEAGEEEESLEDGDQGSSLRRRRSDEQEPMKGPKRRHVPTPKHHPVSQIDEWGRLTTVGGGGGIADHEQEVDTRRYSDDISSKSGSLLTSDFNSSGKTASDLSAPVQNSEFASERASEFGSAFDSNTTWAGAQSEVSVSTAKTGAWGSTLDTSSALSQYPGSSTASKLDSGVWGQRSILEENGGLNGTAVTATTSSVARGRASPAHPRGPGGTPARRGTRKKKLDKQASSMSSIGGASVHPAAASKPRNLPRPLSTPRRAAMSPHGVAMDAAMRIVDERGARLGIVREEGDAGTDRTGRDPSYANQIAAPAMTSLEQRRQRAKAWAKSRYAVCYVTGLLNGRVFLLLTTTVVS